MRDKIKSLISEELNEAYASKLTHTQALEKSKRYFKHGDTWKLNTKAPEGAGPIPAHSKIHNALKQGGYKKVSSSAGVAGTSGKHFESHQYEHGETGHRVEVETHKDKMGGSQWRVSSVREWQPD